MVAENRKNNFDWLVDKLRMAERERDEALELASDLANDNLRLRVKLQAISNFLSGEEFVEDLYIPDDEFSDLDIPDTDDDCSMPSI